MKQTDAQHMSDERRKYVRVATQCLLTCEKFTAQNLGITNAENKIEAITKDLSAGGILFEASEQYEIGTLLKFEINVPGWERFKAEFYKNDRVSSSAPLVLLASVVRVEVIETGKRYDIGACFVAIDDGHQWALVKYINSRLKKQQ